MNSISPPFRPPFRRVSLQRIPKTKTGAFNTRSLRVDSLPVGGQNPFRRPTKRSHGNERSRLPFAGIYVGEANQTPEDGFGFRNHPRGSKPSRMCSAFRERQTNVPNIGVLLLVDEKKPPGKPGSPSIVPPKQPKRTPMVPNPPGCAWLSERKDKNTGR